MWGDQGRHRVQCEQEGVRWKGKPLPRLRQPAAQRGLHCKGAQTPLSFERVLSSSSWEVCACIKLCLVIVACARLEYSV